MPDMASASSPHPTDEDALIALHDLLARDAAAEDQISALEATTERHRRARQELQNRIYYYRAMIAPVRKVPVEILGYIFGFLVGSAPDAIFQASRVCRVWRGTTMLSQLWSNIVVTSESWAAIHRAHLYLKRSGQAPLSVTFVQSLPHNFPWSTWNIVKASNKRWSSLSLTLDDASVASSEIRSLPAIPTLTELSVTIRGHCFNWNHDRVFGFEPAVPYTNYEGSLASSPHVRRLHLSTFVIPLPGDIFARLTKLSINDTFCSLGSGPGLSPIQWEDLVTLLSFCLNLEEFVFNAEGTVPWLVQHPINSTFDPKKIPALPRLRILDLHCHHSFASFVLACLDSSHLESASLRMRPRHATSMDEVLELEILRLLSECPLLRTLRILAMRGPATISALAHALPLLETLHIEHSTSPDDIVRALGKSGRIEDFDDEIWLAPQLSTLIIDAEVMLLDHYNLRLLVGARHSNNLAYGIPKALHSLVVNGREMVKGVPPGTITDFERKERFSGKTWEMHQGRLVSPLAKRDEWEWGSTSASSGEFVFV